MSDIDSLIKRATDATLTSDNWEYILDVCDKISLNPETETKKAIKAISTRLNVKDANTNLRSLTLLVAIGENCGSRMKQEIASKAFLNDNLIKKLSDRKVHNAIKFQVVQTIIQLNDTFKSDPSLKPIAEAYKKISRDFPQYLPPSKPEKKKITQQDKTKEDDELQRILKLSLQEYEREQTLKTHQKNKPLPDTSEAKENRENSTTPEPTIATVSKVKALYDLISYEPDELSFRKGDVITVIESVYRDWWRGMLTNGKIGIFPLNYVTPIVNKSPEEIQKELEIENRILDKSKKVDRLLSLLSSPNPNENELTLLYNEIIPLRPQLGKFIDKYGVRKEELFALNNQLNHEVKEYNDLMDNTIASRTYTYQGSTPYPTGGFGPTSNNQFPVPLEQVSGISTQNIPTQFTSNANQPQTPLQPAAIQDNNTQQPYNNVYNGTAMHTGQFNSNPVYPPPQPSYNQQLEPAEYTTEPPPTSFQQYTTQSQRSNNQQPQQYLQQQATSTGFGNSPDQGFLNINHYPEVQNL